MLRSRSTRPLLALRLLGFTLLGLSLLFWLETWWELRRSGVSWDSLETTSGMGKALASTVSRAFNNLLTMVLGFVSLAIPLTANMYTPKLVEIFFSDRLNIAALLFFAAMGAHAVFAQWVMFDQWAPVTHVTALWISGVIGFIVLIPYYLYVLDFLNPVTIIERVRDRIISELPKVGREPSGELQPHVQDRIMQLGNVILRAVDRADRDVAIDAIAALEHTYLAYARIKPSLPAEWFEVRPSMFPGLSSRAIALLNRDRTWFEHRCLSQLHLAYVASLAKMPDAVGAISVVNRRLALHNVETGDDAAVALSIRYFNTFVRTALTKRDLHATYDVFHQYRGLAVELLAVRPDRSREIARHLRYYGEFARVSGLPFVFELASAEIAQIVGGAFERNSPQADEILAEFEATGQTGQSPRFAKAAALLAAQFAAADRKPQLARMRAMLASIIPETLSAARRDVAATTDPVFWEVTDRQVNLDWVEPERRDAVLAVLDEFIAARKT